MSDFFSGFNPVLLILIVIVAFILVRARTKSPATPTSIAEILEALRASASIVKPAENSPYPYPTVHLTNKHLSLLYVNSEVGENRVETVDIVVRRRSGSRTVITMHNGNIVEMDRNKTKVPLRKLSTQTNYQIHQLFQEIRTIVGQNQ